MSTPIGLETLAFQFAGGQSPGPFRPVLVGVVGSGNLEVMIEPAHAADTACDIHIDTSARGFHPIWAAVVTDFHARHALAGVTVSINDMGATPGVVSLRLDQAVAELRAQRPSAAGTAT